MASPCTTNATSYEDPTLTTSIKVRSIHINQLQEAINRERTRRGTAAATFSKVDTTVKAIGTHIQELYNTIVALNGTYPVALDWTGLIATLNVTGSNTDKIISLRSINDLRTNLNKVEQACLCNCNYCTCDCNYCTCNCNYCPCNCNQCSCNTRT